MEVARRLLHERIHLFECAMLRFVHSGFVGCFHWFVCLPLLRKKGAMLGNVHFIMHDKFSLRNRWTIICIPFIRERREGDD